MNRESVFETYVRPLYPIFILVAVFWALEVVDTLFLGLWSLDTYGIRPRQVTSLPNIFTSPFLHGGFAHVGANSVPFLVLGALIMWRSKLEFWLVTLWVAIIAGIGIWFTGSANSNHIGASGVVFGYFGFLVLLGWFERSPVSIVRAVIIGLLYGGLIWGVLPGQEGISWQGHLFGFIGGAVCASWLARRYRLTGKGSLGDNLKDRIRAG